MGTPSCRGSLAPCCGLQHALGWEGEAKGAEDAKLSLCHTAHTGWLLSPGNRSYKEFLRQVWATYL